MTRTIPTKLISRLLAIISLLLIPHMASATVLVRDTVWQGVVDLQEDLLVPAGITLTIKPGTVIHVKVAESTKTDPEYLSSLTEITVRGTLNVEGRAGEPVLFDAPAEKKPGSWAGIIVDGGKVDMRFSRVLHAESAVYVFDGTVALAGVDFRENRNGISVLGSKGSVKIDASVIARNDFGIFTLKGGKVDCTGCTVSENRKKDYASGSSPEHDMHTSYASDNERAAGMIYGDQALVGDTVWQGRVEVRGVIRVPEKSRLLIMPGTVVEFARKDTNGDGLGENGLLIQGVIIAKGSAAAPIIFRSAEKHRKMGDWDSINIMNSDGVQNLIEYCQIEDAYRALHFHFSNVLLAKSILRNNYRGVQFQESNVAIRSNMLYANKSGIQGRDSVVDFIGNTLSNNYLGGNFFRCNIKVAQNIVRGNRKEGLRLREGVMVVEENLFDGSRYGLMVADTFYGSFSRNLVINNDEIGFSLKNTDNVDISDNFIVGNNLNGLNIQDSRGLVRGNQIAGNGERGIGIISFDGAINGNNLVRNGLYAIDLEGKNDISASGNWWGGVNPDAVIYDRLDDPARGKVHADTPLLGPVPFVWPVREMPSSTTWEGEMVVKAKVDFVKGATLTVLPGTKVAFDEGAGMMITGKLIAKGEPSREILFTSLQKKESGAWDEVQLEYANNSVFDHVTIEYATWGVHSHFTNLLVSNCRFRHNHGGLRFRSGPITVTKSLFADNTIGIRAYRGIGLISENAITRNETGIFVREKGGGLTISRNNLAGNNNLAVRIGDFNNEDVNARENWWGEGDPVNSVFDGRSEPGIGMVIFEPYLRKPAAAGPMGGW